MSPRPLRRRLAPAAVAVAAILGLVVPMPPSVRAASALLESVKQNPALARSMCARFKEFNAQGQSATSKESISWVASSQGLSPIDAEVLTTYVIGLHCPDVR
jgi:hypothetical protein